MKIHCRKCGKNFSVTAIDKKTICPHCQSNVVEKECFLTEEDRAYCMKCQTTFGIASQEIIKCPKCQHRNKARPLWQSSLEEKEVLEQAEAFMDENICYGKDKILGFPGTNAHPISKAIMAEWSEYHPNNIGVHTIEGEHEVGFNGTQEAEKQVIAMMADLIDASLDEVDGYISPGGTEANLSALWMGRDARKGEKAAVVCSFLTHYSVVKNANILGIGCHHIGTDENGHILLDQLEEKIRSLVRKGINNIVVVGNAGTTMLGSVDDIPAMSKIIKKAREKFSWINIHFHIDAAFGGFVIPFIDDLPKIGFSNESVDTVSIDAHKMGLIPYGSGVIMSRKGLFERVKTESPYVPGNDCSVCGSRPGVIALCCWAVMKRMSKDGYEKMAKELVDQANQTRIMFEEKGIPTFKNDINIVAIKGNPPSSFITHSQNDFPVDMAKPSLNRTSSLWNIVFMPHVTRELIDECLAKMLK